jgi:hypothetical protein
MQLSLLYFILINIVYFSIYTQYFQQDEWFYLSYFHQFPLTLYGAWDALTVVFHDPSPFAYHFTPIGTLLWWFESQIFGINFPLYALLSLLVHAGNSYFVYGFARRITRNNFIAFIAGFFFALTFSHSQAVTWMSALPTEFAVLFALLSINYFIDFLKSKNNKKYFLSILFFLISVFSKETGVFLIIFLPLLAILYKSYDSFKNLKLFYTAGVGYLAFRIFMPPLVEVMTHTKSVAAIALKNTDIFFSFYYTFTFVIKAFSEAFFSLGVLKQFSIVIADFGYPQYTAQKAVGGSEYLTFIQSAATDIALYLTGLIVIIFCLATFFHFSFLKQYKKAFLISFFLILFSILPITMLTGWLMSFFSYVSIIESRHLYTTNIGMSIIFGFFIYWVYLSTQKRFLWKIAMKYFFMILLVIWVIVQVVVIFNDPSTDSKTAKDRKALVALWLNETAHLDKKTVFYSESNVALYGFAEYMLPLQVNPAQVIVGTYGLKQQLPEKFYKKEFLFKPLTKEWYQEYEGIGLGYFLTKKHLFQTVRENKLQKEDIIAVQYDGNMHTIHSVTAAVRAELFYYLDDLKRKKDWTRYENKKTDYTFIYPPNYEVRDLVTGENDLISAIEVVEKESEKQLFSITIFKKPDGMGVSNFAAGLDDGMGENIGSNLTFKGIQIGPTKEAISAVLVKNDINDQYFFNTKTNGEVKRIIITEPQTEGEERLMQSIIQNLEFNN